MPGLTTREASVIEEGLHLEETLVTKFGAYARQVTDPECRRILTEIQSLHQHHYDLLRRQAEASAAGPIPQANLGQPSATGGYAASVTGC